MLYSILSIRTATYVILFMIGAISTQALGAESDPKCTEGQFFVKAHHRQAYTTSSGKHVRATNVKSHCKTLNPSAQFWLSRLKDGAPPNWPHKTEMQSSWSTEQKERVLSAMEELPELLEVASIDGIYRLKNAKDSGNPASHTEGMIVIYDNAFSRNRNLGRIIAHEAAHELYSRLDESSAYDYRKFTGWTLVLEGREIYWQGRKSGYIEEDGKLSPAEDYANNIEGYIFEPERLNRVSPEAYIWIKKRYGDKLNLRSKK